MRKKRSYTPEPWIIQGKAIYDEWANSFYVVLVYNANGKTSIFQKIFGITREEAEANAKLIAAAPKLLKALKQMKRMYEKVLPAGGWQGVYDNACMVIEEAEEPEV